MTVLGIIGWPEIKPHFEVTVSPLEVEVFQGSREIVIASVKNTSIFGWKYKYPINVEVEDVPKGVNCSFSPESPTRPNYECKAIFDVGREVPEGKYKITFTATGDNGDRRQAAFFIIVKRPPCPDPYVREVNQYFAPKGWMCNIADIELDDQCRINPLLGPTCIKIDYSARTNKPCQRDGWVGAGIYWLCDGCDWGKQKPDPIKYNFSCAKSLVFWARGERGGEKAEFIIGGVTGDYEDSINPPRTTGLLTLSKEWKKYRIDFQEGDDLSSMISGFCWVTDRSWNPNGCTIYLDDIKFVDK